MHAFRSNPRWNGLRALVTGGAGFIGSHLADELLARGYHVIVLDDLSTGRLDNVAHVLQHPGFRLIRDSVSNSVTIDQLVTSCDVVFHLAAAVGVDLVIRDPVRVFETNIVGSHVLLAATARHHKKTLIASTSEVYGKSEKIPYHEEDDRVLGPTSNTRWSYAISKAVDEFLALAYHQQVGLPVVIFRLFNTIGPRQTGRYGMVVPRFVQQALRGEPLTVYGDGWQSRCFCDVDDVVRAIVGLAECDDAVGNVFNVGSTAEVTILELARKVLSLVDDRPSSLIDRIKLVPYDQAYAPGFEDTRRRVPDISRIKATIGWQPRICLDDTLHRVFAYYRQDRESRPAIVDPPTSR